MELCSSIKSIAEKHKKTFFITFICMFFTHIYSYTNKLINGDEVKAFMSEPDPGRIEQGRWFKVVLDRIGGRISVPGINMFIICISIAVAICFIAELMEIKGTLKTVALSFVFASFPAMTVTIGYLFVADQYCIAILFSSAAAWCFAKEKLGYDIAGVIILTLSAGTYQSYWCFAVALIYIYAMKWLLEETRDIKAIVKKGLRSLLLPGISLALYAILTKIIQTATNISMTDYAGLNNIGSIDLRTYIFFAKQAYRQALRFYFVDGSFVVRHYLVVFNAIVFLGIALFVVFKSLRKEYTWFQRISAAVLLFMMPFMLKMIFVMSGGQKWMGEVVDLSLIAPYILLVSILPDLSKIKWGRYINIICMASVLIIAYEGFLIANTFYMKLQLDLMANFSAATRLVYRIEETEGYHYGMPVVTMGSEKAILDENYPDSLDPIMESVGILRGSLNTHVVNNESQLERFCEYFLGYDFNTYRGDEKHAVWAEIEKTEEYKNMAVYPAEGSIKVINDMLIIRFRDNAK